MLLSHFSAFCKENSFYQCFFPNRTPFFIPVNFVTVNLSGLFEPLNFVIPRQDMMNVLAGKHCCLNFDLTCVSCTQVTSCWSFKEFAAYSAVRHETMILFLLAASVSLAYQVDFIQNKPAI